MLTFFSWCGIIITISDAFLCKRKHPDECALKFKHRKRIVRMAKLLNITSYLYRKIGTFILHLLNYNKIENEQGTYHIGINIIDFLLAVAYLVFSIWKLKTITQVVFWTNFIVLLRLLIKNVKSSFNLREQYKRIYNNTPGALLKSPYDIKLMFEIPVILVFIVILCCNGFPFSEDIVLVFAVVVLFLSFLEHYAGIVAEVFEASVELQRIGI